MNVKNFISDELKNKIINGKILTEQEISLFFRYVIYKVNVILSYKNIINSNLSKEYAALCSEILFSYNLEAEKKELNNHYFCVVKINNYKYLCDLSEEKYKYIKLSNDVYQEYILYIKERYDE